MKYDTIREAAEAWVNEMNCVSTEMIRQLMEFHPDEWEEVTCPTIGDRCYATSYDGDGVATHNGWGEIVGTKESDNEILYEIKFYELDEVQTCERGDIEIEYDSLLPMWGWMWSFGDNCDDWWLEKGDGVQKMSKCGFRIYYHEEWGWFFGIDGAGYDFYSEHWIPLYKARGLHWHKEEE